MHCSQIPTLNSIHGSWALQNPQPTSCLKLSLPLEIIIKPQRSASFARLLVCLCLFSITLILLTSLPFLIKVPLAIGIGWHTIRELKIANPLKKLIDIHIRHEDCLLHDVKQGLLQFDNYRIPFSNPLFQLMTFKNATTTYPVVLFNDQVSLEVIKNLQLMLLRQEP